MPAPCATQTPGAGAHDGLERRHHAAGGYLHHGTMIGIEIVDVGLAVRNDDDLRRSAGGRAPLAAAPAGVQFSRKSISRRCFSSASASTWRTCDRMGRDERGDLHRREIACRECRRPAPRPIGAIAAMPRVRSQREQQHRDADEHQHEIPRTSFAAGRRSSGRATSARETASARRNRNRSARSAPIRTAVARCASRRRRDSPPPGRKWPTGASPVLNIDVPSLRHTNTASRRSSAVILSRYARSRDSLPFSTRFVIGSSIECITELRAQFDVRAKPLGQQSLDVGQTEVGHDAGRECHRQHEAQHDGAEHLLQNTEVSALSRRPIFAPTFM